MSNYNIFWVSYESKLELRHIITPEESFVELSYSTHPYIIHNIDNDKCLLFRLGNRISKTNIILETMWNSEYFLIFL